MFTHLLSIPMDDLIWRNWQKIAKIANFANIVNCGALSPNLPFLSSCAFLDISALIRSLSVSTRSSGVLGGVMSVSSLSPKLGSRYCAIESSRWDIATGLWGYNSTSGFDSLQVSSAVLWKRCCKLFEGKVEKFTQFRSRQIVFAALFYMWTLWFESGPCGLEVVNCWAFFSSSLLPSH